MARLSAVAKALYYPTPMEVIDLIADQIPLEGDGTHTILDTCAGTGAAVARLASRWHLKSYGVELQKDRAWASTCFLNVTRHGSYHQLRVEPSSPFSVLFLNPPYDDEGPGLRQEVIFLEEALPHLAHNGLLVFIPPAHILKNQKFVDLMRSQCRDIRVWRFPDPLYDAFKQVVVVARSFKTVRHYGYGHQPYYGYTNIFDQDPPVLGETPPLEDTSLPPPIEITSFRMAGVAPETISPTFNGTPSGGYASQKWLALTGDAVQDHDAPLLRPRPGHQAMLLAAGRLNGVELDGCLVKGGSDKILTEIEGEKETILRESIVSHLSTLDLKTGELDTWRVNDDPERTSRWFEKYGHQLARAISESHTPVFDGDLSTFDFSSIQAPGILPGKDKPELLPLQKEAAAGIAFRWRKHKAAILSGELGVGKTTIAITACELSSHPKIVVICPSHLVKKWIRECESITGVKGIAVSAKTISDVDRFFEPSIIDDGFLGIFKVTRPNPARYLILSKETAKLGSRWTPSFQLSKRRIAREEHRHVRESAWRTFVETVVVRETQTLVTCPKCGGCQEDKRPEDLDVRTKLNCVECKEPLWQVAPLNAKGTRRWPLASYINLRYARRYALVLDEAHQFSKTESDQSKAVQMLATTATKILAMTGTLYGGRASSLFPLLFKVEESFRKLYQYHECALFVEHHGLFETVYQEEEQTSIYGYRRGGGRSGGRVREIPGMSPAMIPLILPYTIFVKLKDLGIDLPPYTEIVELVSHQPEIEAESRDMAQEVRSVLREYPEVLGQYLQACLGYPDCPEQAEKIVAPETDEHGEVVLAEARSFPREIQPKDQRVLDIVLDEHAQGRKTLIFMTQTHRRDARGRLKEALESKGLRVAILDASVSPERREDWLRKQEQDGFDVMITNGRLVETGLDLLFAHTIIQYGIEYSVPTLRQSIRRSWRLGQTKPVRVYFLAYARTMQAIAIDLIAKKMRASEMVDGDETGGLAQHDVGGTNFLVELAHAAIQGD